VEEFNQDIIAQPETTKSGGARFLRIVADILETLILAVVLFVGINYITARIRVDGSSMEPTLHSGQFVLVNRLAYRLGEPALGDIMVFYFPGNPEQEYIKRLIGLPGDHISIRDQQVYVNGLRLDEPYIAAPPQYVGEWDIPLDHFFVLGDNRNNSSDSHSWGTVPNSYVIGKAVLIYWPFADLRLIPGIPHASATP
jgi:signal peptidase I